MSSTKRLKPLATDLMHTYLEADEEWIAIEAALAILTGDPAAVAEYEGREVES